MVVFAAAFFGDRQRSAGSSIQLFDRKALAHMTLMHTLTRQHLQTRAHIVVGLTMFVSHQRMLRIPMEASTATAAMASAAAGDARDVDGTGRRRRRQWRA